MAEFTHNVDSGSMFVNARKTTDRHPDRTGSGLIKCPHCEAETVFRISGWVKEGKAGRENWLSLAFTPDGGGGEARPASSSAGGEKPAPVSRPAPPPSGSSRPGGFTDNIDDDIPF